MLWAAGSIQGSVFSDYPGGRQDLIFVGSGNVSWTAGPHMSLGAGLKFTRQISSQSDLGWKGFNVLPRVAFSMTF